MASITGCDSCSLLAFAFSATRTIVSAKVVLVRRRLTIRVLGERSLESIDADAGARNLSTTLSLMPGAGDAVLPSSLVTSRFCNGWAVNHAILKARIRTCGLRDATDILTQGWLDELRWHGGGAQSAVHDVMA